MIVGILCWKRLSSGLGAPRWRAHRSQTKLKVVVASESASEIEEGLMGVVVSLGRNVVVLEVLLAVEGDPSGLVLAIFDLDLVSAQDNWDRIVTGRVAV
jgi:hypothetical protein